ncbi:viperin family antiviral radical SAM protein [Methanimicrococcus sp. OttesenSCG-928-J09]|nr:viperin family antiviral radical SAM protein [Methanimicrococcus sp. OttesenSCG-928-J09]
MRKIQSINWHITDRCNYGCKFCYVQNLCNKITDIKKCESILSRFQETKTDLIDIRKINFVGGEPLLHPHIMEFVKMSHDMGFVTSIVTNGSLLNEKNIGSFAPYLDWIGLSVDSASNEIESLLGRGNGNHVTHSKIVAQLVHDYDIKLKINTTVTKVNYEEKVHALISELGPHRWKIFQMLHIKGQNDLCLQNLSITDEEFAYFKNQHEDVILRNNVKPTFEFCNDMKNSYIILDPVGNVLSNRTGEYVSYTLDDLFENTEKIIDIQKYISRGAIDGI